MKLIYVSCTCHVYECVPGERKRRYTVVICIHVLQKEFNFMCCVDACIKKKVGGWLRHWRSVVVALSRHSSKKKLVVETLAVVVVTLSRHHQPPPVLHSLSFD